MYVALQQDSQSTGSQHTVTRLTFMQALKDSEVHLNVDLMHMYSYDKDLYDQLVAYPGEVIPLLDVEAREIAEDFEGEALRENQMLTVNSAAAVVVAMLYTLCTSIHCLLCTQHLLC